jgi:hypothetical protein
MRLPKDSERIIIAGRTGSGKTQEALWQLSNRSFDEMPWLMVDFKNGGDLVGATPVTAEIPLSGPPPTEPGLYATRASIRDCDKGGRMEPFLLECLDQGNIGLFIDEGTYLGQHNTGLRMILTQGRSKRVPLIFLTQRPRHIETFALSESEFLHFFKLQHPDDYRRVEEYIDPERMPIRTLYERPPHWSYCWDTVTDSIELLPPCEPISTIMDRIITRLPKYVDAPAGGPLPRMRVKI